MKVYIAGKLGTPSERERLEEIDSMCKQLGYATFLPHRDAGFALTLDDAQSIFEKDILKGLAQCKAVVASLDGLHIGAGTAWELGYAYAKGIPIIGLKTDESVSDSFEYLSSILIASMPIVDSLDKVKHWLKKQTN
jgi:nucleoside 2-deoxyribosyltransferase